MTLPELTVLIKLLKAEGVREYTNNGLTVRFGPEVAAGARGRDKSGEAAPPQAEEAEAADASPAVDELPPALRKLNPNYLKLSGVVKRG